MGGGRLIFLFLLFFFQCPPLSFHPKRKKKKKEIKVKKHSKALETQILDFAKLMRLWQPYFTSHEELDIKEAILPLWLKKSRP